jgi:hypothetical protein
MEPGRREAAGFFQKRPGLCRGALASSDQAQQMTSIGPRAGPQHVIPRAEHLDHCRSPLIGRNRGLDVLSTAAARYSSSSFARVEVNSDADPDTAWRRGG